MIFLLLIFKSWRLTYQPTLTAVLWFFFCFFCFYARFFMFSHIILNQHYLFWRRTISENKRFHLKAIAAAMQWISKYFCRINKQKKSCFILVLSTIAGFSSRNLSRYDNLYKNTVFFFLPFSTSFNPRQITVRGNL